MNHGTAIGKVGQATMMRRGSRCLALLLCLLVSSSHILSAAKPPAAVAPSAEQIQRLIEALGNSDYFVRQKAEADLSKIGFNAVDALTAAAEHDDMEIATRANRLLYVIRSDWSISGAPPFVARLLTDYDAQDDSSRETRI